jgi:hypothetical protein
VRRRYERIVERDPHAAVAALPDHPEFNDSLAFV